MRIKQLRLKNYRCFEDLDISFAESCINAVGEQENINVHLLLADNMMGKSAILKALRIGVATVFSNMKGAKVANNRHKGITQEEHRLLGEDIFAEYSPSVSIAIKSKQQLYLKKGQQGSWEEKELNWERYKSSPNGKTKTKPPTTRKNHVAGLFRESYNQIVSKKERLNPLCLYLGAEYVHIQQSSRKDYNFAGRSAMEGYWYCLDDSNMESYVFNWLSKLELSRREAEATAGGAQLYGRLPAHVHKIFKRAVQTVLPDIKDVDFVKMTQPKKGRLFEAVFSFKEEGYRRYEMLSDGYRYMVLLLGELAVRSTLLNKHYLEEDILDRQEGVVLIDEFGIHLHPRLQRQSLSRLSKLFPKLQFIVSTHSPLLVNGLYKEQIHLIVEDADKKRISIQPDTDAIGLGAEGILREMFAVPVSLDQKTLDWQKEYIQLLAKMKKKSSTEEEKQRFRELSALLAKQRAYEGLEQQLAKQILSLLGTEEQLAEELREEKLLDYLAQILND